MLIPEWASDDFSHELPVLRARGEGQALEYMVCFPTQARELAKEMAAFATTNQGVIILGMDDSGDLVGLAEASTQEGRDTLLRRIEGISHGTIKPAITPSVTFAVETDKVVLIILVPKGGQPLYYCESRPYIRHLSQSRPAEPHEVIELVQKWSSVTGVVPQVDPLPEFLLRVAPILTDVLIYAEELDDRMLNPWLQMMRTQFQQAAGELRELALEEVVCQNGLDAELGGLAEALEEIATTRLRTENSGAFMQAIRDVGERTVAFKKAHINRVLHKQPLDLARAELRVAKMKLSDLAERALKMVEQGRVNEMKSEASEIGLTLCRIAQFDLDRLQPGLSVALQSIGRDLHLMETANLFLDGGRSMRALIDRLRQANQSLNQLLA